MNLEREVHMHIDTRALGPYSRVKTHSTVIVIVNGTSTLKLEAFLSAGDRLDRVLSGARGTAARPLLALVLGSSSSPSTQHRCPGHKRRHPMTCPSRYAS